MVAAMTSHHQTRAQRARVAYAAASRRKNVTGVELMGLRVELTTSNLMTAIERAIRDGLDLDGTREAIAELERYVACDEGTEH